MAMPAISGSTPYPAQDSMPKTRGQEEITTVTTKCNKDHWHDQSCPHTVTTKPAEKTEKMQPPGHELYERA